jgi:hypothetical protein
MAMITHKAGIALTPEEDAKIRAEIRSAAKRPYIYDPDCPPLTDEQLAQFRPVNGMSWEERERLMQDNPRFHSPIPAETVASV